MGSLRFERERRFGRLYLTARVTRKMKSGCVWVSRANLTASSNTVFYFYYLPVLCMSAYSRAGGSLSRDTTFQPHGHLYSASIVVMMFLCSAGQSPPLLTRYGPPPPPRFPLYSRAKVYAKLERYQSAPMVMVVPMTETDYAHEYRQPGPPLALPFSCCTLTPTSRTHHRYRRASRSVSPFTSVVSSSSYL